MSTLRLALLLLWLLAACAAQAGVMTRERLAAAFPAPLVVGERDAALPVWPVFKQEATETVLVAYLFESIDFAPVPGFSGTPVNLLVALDAQGRFLEVRVLSQHEPVFLDGLGEAPLMRFVEQYKGLSLKHSLKVGSAHAQAERANSAAHHIDGVAKATASVRIVHQSLLSAALKVARAKLGYAQGRDPDRVSRVRQDLQPTLDWRALLRTGLLRHLRLTHGEVERAFAGSVGEGQAPATAPDAPFAELYLAYLNAPAVGRNLLSARGWQRLLDRLEPGDHALLVVGRGEHSFVGDHWVRGAVPDRLSLRQGELPVELRDLDLDEPLALPPALRGADAKVLRVIGASGLDPGQPFELRLRVTRSKGQLYPERVSRDFALRYALPADHVIAPPDDGKAWHAAWRERAPLLAVLGAGLVLLTGVLLRPRWWVARPQRLQWFRTGFLLFTLVFIGWHAQGQLSIVNLSALLQALAAGGDLSFFLFDPVSLVLWAFVALTLLLWGRGSFCGWLCPFGALQELTSRAARWLRIPRMQLHHRTDARLKRLKYLLLGAIVLASLVSAAWTDRLVELEPFKTAITLGFVRSGPHVLWAGGLVLLSAWVYKGYCRYLCPLGAALALAGRVRRLRWIARRAECGRPCQTCRHRCEYQAIEPSGEVRYDECFQCLDCVAIHASDTLCAPRIAARRGRHKVFTIHPVAKGAAR
ncbi:MAG: 4Fe-4S binding protein [Pseudomonadota bacterium]